MRAPLCRIVWFVEEVGGKIIFYRNGNILEAAASAIAGKSLDFWLELGMKGNGYFIQKLIMYSMSPLCLESRPLVQLLYSSQFLTPRREL